MDGPGEAAAASKARILAGGKNWKSVLGVAASAHTEDVKKAYRKLVLVHHPDKIGGDVDTFRLVHQAYVLGVKKCRKSFGLGSSAGGTKAGAAGGVGGGGSLARGAPEVIPCWMRDCFGGGSQAPAADESQGRSPAVSKGKAKGKAKGQAKGKAKAQARPEAEKVALRETQRREAAGAELASTAAAAASSTHEFLRRMTRPMDSDQRSRAEEEKQEEDLKAAKKRVRPQPVSVDRATVADAAAAAFASSKRAAATASAKAQADEAAERAAKRAARPKPWVLAEGTGASKPKVCKAISQWEGAEAHGLRTMPDEVAESSPEELAEWVRTSSCVPVDVREHKASLEVQGSEQLSFFQLFNSPDQVLPQVAKLKADGRRLVFFSEQGDRMAVCGIVAAVLQDVFGFDCSLVSRLRGGCRAWSQWLDDNPSVARSVEPLSARLARRRVAAAACAAGACKEREALPEALRKLCAQTGGG
mmetsp:Transcript_29760/g.98709  ORF Transcript_29760/g.98709 Transcript_29760/m.98709 type:complete len:474 (-) Transcript_29760:285-1706(-)